MLLNDFPRLAAEGAEVVEDVSREGRLAIAGSVFFRFRYEIWCIRLDHDAVERGTSGHVLHREGFRIGEDAGEADHRSRSESEDLFCESPILAEAVDDEFLQTRFAQLFYGLCRAMTGMDDDGEVVFFCDFCLRAEPFDLPGFLYP